MIQGCSLGLDVSVSRRSRDVVSKRLGLVSVSHHRVSFTSQCAQLFAFIAKLHLHRFECKASILLLIHKFTYLLQCKCISRCHLVRMYGSAQATLCYMGTQSILSGSQQPAHAPRIFGPSILEKRSPISATAEYLSYNFGHFSSRQHQI